MAENQQNEQLKVQEQSEKIEVTSQQVEQLQKTKQIVEGVRVEEGEDTLNEIKDSLKKIQNPKYNENDINEIATKLNESTVNLSTEDKNELLRTINSIVEEGIEKKDILDLINDEIKNYKIEQKVEEKKEIKKENLKSMEDYKKTINSLKSSTISLDKSSSNYGDIVDRIQKISSVNEDFKNYEEVKGEVDLKSFVDLKMGYDRNQRVMFNLDKQKKLMGGVMSLISRQIKIKIREFLEIFRREGRYSFHIGSILFSYE